MKSDCYIESLPKKMGFKMPAEWTHHECCWMMWPHILVNWRKQAVPAQLAFIDIAKAISNFEPVKIGVPKKFMEKAKLMIFNQSDCKDDISRTYTIQLFEIESDDTWARDIGPTFLVHSSEKISAGIKWDFNGWGNFMKNYENDKNVSHSILKLSNCQYKFRADFILEGGSFHVDGEGTILTTEECLLNKNRNPHLSKEQIESYLIDYLGGEKVIWLKRGLFNDNDTSGHVDNICTFIEPGHLMISWTDDKTDPQYEISQECLAILESTTDAKGRHFKVTKIPIPKAIYYSVEDIPDEGDLRKVGERLPASYVNYYLANDGVVIPGFGDQDSDKNAFDIFEKVFPTRKIRQVCTKEILLGGGNIHCLTQQQPKFE